jgi:hypothetical protein
MQAKHQPKDVSVNVAGVPAPGENRRSLPGEHGDQDQNNKPKGQVNGRSAWARAFIVRVREFPDGS